MKNVLIGILIAVVAFFVYKNITDKASETTTVKEHSALIQEQIKNVGKLVVTEGHFSQVLDYKKSKAIFTQYLSANKKALVVVNADVTVAYDLSKVEFIVDEQLKTITITKIPEEEIKISPELEYYDVQQDYLNPFSAEDYNNIKDIVKKQLLQKVENSNLKTNAKNRLISELSKLYVLTNSLGWTLRYNEEPVTDVNALELKL